MSATTVERILAAFLPLVLGAALIMWVGLTLVPSDQWTHASLTNHQTMMKIENVLMQHKDDDSESDLPLDFVIAGFEKCGTSYLMHLLEQHNETDMVRREFCQIKNRKRDDEELYVELQDELRLLPSSLKLGIKCPSLVRHEEGLRRLQQWYPETKLVVGLRHPVHWFQSFYNFRVMRVHDGKFNTTIPPASSLTKAPWLHVSTENARFEYDLSKLNKTHDTRNGNSVSPSTPFPIMVFSLEQVMDTNETRRFDFARGLAEFLGLASTLPLQPVVRNATVDDNFTQFQEASNTNPSLDNFTESVDICQDEYAALRHLLVEQGKKTQEWIRDEFMSSPDVTVVNREYFLETLEEWRRDPCGNKA